MQQKFKFNYDVRRPAYRLIDNYLLCRNQFVVVNNTQSSLKLINIGFSLGPILYKAHYFFSFTLMVYVMQPTVNHHYFWMMLVLY